MERRSKPKRGKNVELGKAEDIFVGERRGVPPPVLDLRRRRLGRFGLKIGRREFDAALDYMKRHRAGTIGVAAVAIILVIAAIGRISYADNARFYPTTCLGGWQDPSHAEGQPDVSFNGTNFSPDNSAALGDAIQTIYCGGFSGQVPQDTQPKSVTVTLSWESVQAQVAQVEPTPSTGANAGAGDDAADSATTTATSSDDIAPQDILPASDASAAGDASDTTATDTIPSTDDNSSSDTSPVSWLMPLTAYAQEADTSTDAIAPDMTTTPDTTTTADTTNDATDTVSAASPAPSPTSDDDLLEVQYTLDGKNWNILGTLPRADLSNTSFEIPIAAIDGWRSLKNLQVSVQSTQSVSGEPVVYLDSVGLIVEYQDVPTISSDAVRTLPHVTVDDTQLFDDPQEDFQPGTSPEFDISVPSTPPIASDTTAFSATGGLFTPLGNGALTSGTPVTPVIEPATPPAPGALPASDVPDQIISAQVFAPDGSVSTDTPVIGGNGDNLSVSVPAPPHAFKAGIYKLQVQVLDGDEVLVATHEFAWGVLAINTDQSTYAPGQDAYIQISALDSEGRTQCNADLQLTIQREDGSTDTFTTGDGTVKESATCGADNVTDAPDYYVNYAVGDPGTYAMTLTNTDTGFEVQGELDVTNDAPYVVTRTAASRINPFQSAYTMRIHVAAASAFHGEILETVPQGFSILNESPDAFVTDQPDGSQRITWPADVAAGKATDLAYTFQAPLVSPELYVLGPLALIGQGNTEWDEGHSWQIASDAACSAVTTGNWGTGADWSGCTGTGGIPAAGDTVTINSGVIMTVTSTEPVASILIATSSAANGITIGAGGILNVTNGITIDAPSGAVSSTINVGGGTLQASTITIFGSATASHNAIMTVATGTIAASSSITFVGTAAQAQFTVTSAATIKVGGDFGAGGTLTTTGGTASIFNFNGTVAQNMNGYATYPNVIDSNTANTLTATGTVTMSGTLTVATSSTMDLGVSAATITSSTNVFGTLKMTSVTGAKTFIGLVTVNPGATWNNSGNNAPVLRGGLTNNGTFTAGTGAYTFNTNNQTVAGTSSTTIPNVSVTSPTVLTNNNTVAFIASTTLSGTGIFLQGANAILNIGAASAITTLSASSTGNIVNYNGGAAQTIKATTYTTLKINNTLGATLAASTTVTTLTIGDTTPTSTFSDGGFILSPSGASVVNLKQGIYNLGSASVGDPFPSFSTINIATGTTVAYISPTSTQPIATNFNYSNLTITGAAIKTVNANVDVAGNLTINTTATLNASSTDITLGGNLAGAGTFTGASSTLDLTGGLTQTLGVTTQTFYNLFLDKTTATSASLTVAATMKGALTVNTGTFAIGAVAFTQNGTTTVSDTLNITSSTGIKTFLGLLTMNSGSVWNNSGNSAIGFAAGVVNNGTTFAAGTGVYTFATSSQVISGTSSTTIPSVTVTGVNLTNSLVSFSVPTALAGTGTLIQDVSSILNLAGTSAITGLVATSTPNIVNYIGAAQTAHANAYYNLYMGGSGAKTLTGITTINGDVLTSGTAAVTTAATTTIAGQLNVGPGSSYTVAGFAFTVTGTTTVSGTLAHSSAVGVPKLSIGPVIISPGGVWTNAGNSTMEFRGGIVLGGTTFSAGTGVYTFDTNNQSITGTSSTTIPSVTVTGVQLTNSNTTGLSLSTALAGTGTFIQDVNAIANLGGTNTITGFVASSTGNTVNFNGTAAQTVAAVTYYTLESNNINATGAQLAGNVSLTNLIVGNTALAFFDDNSHTIGLNSGSSALLQGGSTYKIETTWPSFSSSTLGPTSTVQYGSASAQTVASAPTYGNLTIIGASTKTPDGALDVLGSTTINNASAIFALGGFSHTLTGNLILTAGTLNCGSSTVTTQGSVSGAGTLNGNTGVIDFTGGANVSIGATTQTFDNLSLDKTTGTSVSMAVNTTINGLLAVNTGTFSIGNKTLTQNGSTTVADTLSITSTTGTKTFTGPVTVTSGGTWDDTIGEDVALSGGLTFNGTSFISGNGTYTFSTNNQTIGDGAAFTIQNMTVTGVNLTNNNTAGLTASTTLAGTGKLIQGTNAQLNIAGTSAIATLVATSTGNDVNYTGPAQTVHANAYYDLDLSGAATGNNKTLTSVGTVNDNLTLSGTASGTTAAAFTVGNVANIGSGSTLGIGGFNFSVTSTTEVAGTLNIDSNAGTKTFVGPVQIDLGGTWSDLANEDATYENGIIDNGALNDGSDNSIFTTNNQAITGSSSVSLTNVVVTGINLTNNSGGLAITNGLSGTGTFTQGANQALAIGGSPTIHSFVANASGNTVDYNGGLSSQTIASTTYNNLTVDDVSQTATLGGPTTVQGDLTINSGTLDVSSSNYPLTVDGDWNDVGSFNPEAGTVIFNGSGTQNVDTGETWYGLAVFASSSRQVTFSSGNTQTIMPNGSLTFLGSLGQLLDLEPGTLSSAWDLAISTSSVTQNVSYVEVEYSNAGSPATAATVSAFDGTSQDNGNNTNWDFFGPITLTLSTTTVGFGSVGPAAARYATADNAGTTTVAVAHTIIAGTSNPNGYTLTVEGGSLTAGGFVIAPIGATSTVSTPGSEQFGFKVSAAGGPGVVTTPYNGSGFAFAANVSTSSQVAASASGGPNTTYSIDYITNVATSTASGNYSTILTYTATANF